jgi:hypothetical protein
MYSLAVTLLEFLDRGLVLAVVIYVGFEERKEFSELKQWEARAADGGLAIRAAEDIVADDRLRRMRLRILDSDRLVAFCEADRHAVRVNHDLVLRRKAGEKHSVPVFVGDLFGETVD